MILTFSGADHVYRVDGVPKDSVTQLLQRSGRGPDYSGVPEHILERARHRGIHVDLACDLHDAGTLDPDSVHPQWRGYVDAWQRFCTQLAVTILQTQGRVYHPELSYAGTYDAVAMIDGAVVLIDRKTSKDLYADPYGLQLAAYAMPGILTAREDGELGASMPVEARWIVHLQQNGKFVIHGCEDQSDFDDFRSVVRLARRTQRYERKKAA